MSESYDLIVIGAGPGGYIAAERAGSRGKRVLLIEKHDLGGTCLNRGCIPTKTLLHSAKLYDRVKDGARYGVMADNPRFDLSVVQTRKDRILQVLRNGVRFQMNRSHVEVVNGEARVIDRRTVTVNDQQYTTSALILATGSTPYRPDWPGADLPHVLDTTQALQLQHVPKRVVVIGANPIGLGVATIFTLADAEVTVVDSGGDFLPEFDVDIANSLRSEIQQRISIVMETDVTAITDSAVLCRVGSEQQEIPADAVVLSLGRMPNVDGLGFENTDLDYDERGIRVDAQMRTNLPGVYAIGDVTGVSMWAHVAGRMAEVAVNNLTGEPDELRLQAVPRYIYSVPEVASVGLSEAEAQARGYDVRIAKLPLNANGRFIAENDGKRGLCKLVIDASNDVLLGAHLVGGAGIDMTFGLAAMIEDEFRVRDIQQLVFAHPTVSEVFRDALFELN